MDIGKKVVSISQLAVSGIAYCMCNSSTLAGGLLLNSAIIAIAPNFIHQSLNELLKYNELRGLLKKNHPLNINHDLENLFKRASIKAIEYIRVLFIEKIQKEDIDLLCDILKKDAVGKAREFLHTNQRHLEEWINYEDIEKNIIDNPDNYLQEIMNYLFGISGQDTSSPLLMELYSFYEKHLLSCFQLAFKEGLKDDPRAFTAFQIANFESLKITFSQSERKQDLILEAIKNLKQNEYNNAVTLLQERLSSDILDVKQKLESYFFEFNSFLQDISSRMNKNHSELLSFLNPEPILTLFSNTSSGQKTVFRSNYIRFYGRELELGKLAQFVRDKDVFAWWILTGPGGTGKSKLSLEFCKQLTASNFGNAGFMSASVFKDFPWTTWLPQKDTFIVIDYASTYYKKIIDILTILSQRFSNFRFKVRILLLERSLIGEWWETLLSGIRQQNLPKPWDNPFELTRLSNNELWHIITAVLREENAEIPDKNTTLHDLISLDEKARPLFAIFSGLAIANGNNIRGWNQEDLLELYLDREQKAFWSNESYNLSDWETHKGLCALITVCGGMSETLVGELITNGVSWLPNVDNFNLEIYDFLGAAKEDERQQLILHAYEPDILGEYFVIKYLIGDKRNPFKARSKTNEFTNIAWEINPAETAHFIIRAFSDFNELAKPLHGAFIALPEDETSDMRKYYWRNALATLCSTFAGRSMFEDARYYFEKLLETRFIFFEHGFATHDICIDLAKENKFDEANGYYKKLKSWMTTSTVPEFFADLQGRAGYMLVKYESQAKRFQECHEILSELIDLCVRFRNPNIYKNFSKSANALGSEYALLQRMDDAFKVFKMLKRFSELHATKEVYSDLAMLICNLYVCYPSAKKEAVEFLLDELRNLAKSSDYDDVYMQLAYILSAMAFHVLENGTVHKAAALYEELYQLSKDRPLFSIINRLSKTNFDFFQFLKDSNDEEQALQFYEKIDSLSELHPNIETLFDKARANASYFNDEVDGNNLVGADERYKIIKAIETEISDRTIQLFRVNGAYELAKKYFYKSDGFKVGFYYNEIKEFNDENDIEAAYEIQAKYCRFYITTWSNYNIQRSLEFLFFELFPLAQRVDNALIWRYVMEVYHHLIYKHLDSLGKSHVNGLYKSFYFLLNDYKDDIVWKEKLPMFIEAEQLLAAYVKETGILSN